MFCFFFNDTATTEIYTLSLHDALPISGGGVAMGGDGRAPVLVEEFRFHADVDVAMVGPGPYGHRAVATITGGALSDRKSTRLNSSHANISYAVFCLKKKIEIRIG